MQYISSRDVHIILDAINILNSDLSLATLPARTLTAVSKLFSVDIVCFDCFSSDNKYVSNQWHSSNELMTPQILGVLAEVIYEHPLFAPILGGNKSEALKISDFMNASQFQRTGIYNEFFRQVGVDRQMIFPLKASPDSVITCALNRFNKDFSEEDRNLLCLFAPHLTMAIQNARMFEGLKSERDYLLTASAKGLIVLNLEGKIKFINNFAVLYLEKYFRNFSSDNLPEKLRSYVEFQILAFSGKEFYNSPPPLFVATGNSELAVSFSFNSQSKETSLLLEEKLKKSASDFTSLGLTQREAEILFWIYQGKTDSDIAFLCYISPRTVQKHIEHIFKKLGVETRTAAVIYALEKCN